MGIQDFRNRNGIQQTMQLLDGIGEDAQSIYRSIKTRSTQKGVVEIMANAEMDAEQKERAMMQLPFATENETYKMFHADYVKKKANQDRIAESERQMRQRLQYAKELDEQNYQQEQGRPEQFGTKPWYTDPAVSGSPEAMIASGQQPRASSTTTAKKYISATKDGKKVMLVIDPATNKQVGEIAVGEVDGKSLPDQLKHWTTERDKAGGKYYGVEGGNVDPMDPTTFEFANEKIAEIIAEMKGVQPGGQATPDVQPAPVTVGDSQLSDEDKQAIEWAKKNPTDPRAFKILAIHGVE